MSKLTKKRVSSAGKENRFFKIILMLVGSAFLWVLFSPGTGVVTLIRAKAELKQLQQKTMELERQNVELRSEIDRLQNEPKHLENLARKEHGLLKKNERVFDFSKPAPPKKEQ